MKKYFILLTLALIFALSLSIFAPVAAEGKLKIVSTTFPGFDFAHQITKDLADVSMLLPPGAESHSYEPTPRDIIKIQDADLFIYVGGEGDVWVSRILESMGDKAPATFKLMDAVTVVEEETVEGMEAEHEHEEGEACDDPDHDHEHEGEEVEYDEHVWTSPENAIAIMVALTDAVKKLDSENEASYVQNATAYTQKLDDLEAQLKDVAKNAKRYTIIVGDRFPFRYLVDELGLDYYAAFPGCSTEVEPSAQTIAFLIDKVKSEKIPVVFYIEFSSHKVADAIAEATGAKTMMLHSAHNISQKELDEGATYVSIMTNNVEALREALN